MSSLFENKQMVHIVSEVIILFGVVMYFNSQTKNLANQIEELSNRFDEQEEKVEALEKKINELVAQRMQQVPQRVNLPPPQPQQRVVVTSPPPPTKKVEVPSVPQVSQQSKIVDVSDNESELDRVLTTELQELENDLTN